MNQSFRHAVRTKLRLLALALFASTATLMVSASAMAPPAPLDLFQQTHTDKSLAKIEMALRLFCGQAGCTLGRGQLPGSGSDTPSEMLWLIKISGVTQFIVAAYLSPGSILLIARVDRDCPASAWSRSHAPQLIEALTHAGIPVKPAHDERCIDPATHPNQGFN